MLVTLNVALQDALTTPHPVQLKNGLSLSYGSFISEDKPGVFTLHNLQNQLATFSIQELPGCCGVAVSFYSEVDPTYREQGIGELLLKVRMSAMRNQKYGSAICTTVNSNEIEKKMLRNAGWIKLYEFRNPKTNNIIETFSVNL